MSEGMEQWWNKRLREAIEPGKWEKFFTHEPVVLTRWDRIRNALSWRLERVRDAWAVLRGEKSAE